MELYHLIYMSSLTPGVSKADVAEILPVSRRRNSLAGVTGMLLFSGYNFIQVLEGKQEVVENIYAAIELDVRHYDLTVLLRQSIASRSFTSWSMGYMEIGAEELRRLEDAFHISGTAINIRLSERHSGIAFGLLSTFCNVTADREL